MTLNDLVPTLGFISLFSLSETQAQPVDMFPSQSMPEAHYLARVQSGDGFVFIVTISVIPAFLAYGLPCLKLKLANQRI